MKIYHGGYMALVNSPLPCPIRSCFYFCIFAKIFSDAKNHY